MLPDSEAAQDQYINMSRLVTISVLDPIAVIVSSSLLLLYSIYNYEYRQETLMLL